MRGESAKRASEMLPGRVVNLLVSRNLQSSMSWPHQDGYVPTNLTCFANLLLSLHLGEKGSSRPNLVMGKEVRRSENLVIGYKGGNSNRENLVIGEAGSSRPNHPMLLYFHYDKVFSATILPI